TRERLVRCAVELAGSGRAAADTDVRSGPVWWAAIPNTASTVGGKHPELALWRDPLVATKLHPPSARSDLVRRPRLLERLEVGARGKLTLLSAPAGFGKT